MIIYLSGAISNRPKKEAEAHFNQAQKTLENWQYKTVNPFDICDIDPLMIEAFCDMVDISGVDLLWEYCMSVCLSHLRRCDAIYMLQGWENSTGACIEKLRAESLGISVWYEPAFAVQNKHYIHG